MHVISSIVRSRSWMHYCAAGVLIAVSVSASPELTIRAEQVLVNSTDTSGRLCIYLGNTTDTVVAFQFWLHLDRPDIAVFEEAFDTAGTLSSGWDLVHVRSITGTGVDAMVIGLADDITNPGAGAPIAPQATERLLVRIPFAVLAIPDTMTDRTAVVSFDRNASYLSFSRPNGTTIGLTGVEVADTACWHCYQWQESSCLDWRRVVGPPCDSTSVTLDTVNVLDSLKLVTVPGSVTIADCKRYVNEVDINGDGVPMAISDLVALMRYIAGETDSIGDRRWADVNGDCVINWGDAILLDSLFSLPYNPPPEIWPVLPCACDNNPVRVCCWQVRGDLNGDIQHMVDLSDLSTLVAYLTGALPSALKCSDEANLDGKGIIDLSDLSYLIAYLVGTGAPPAACP